MLHLPPSLLGIIGKWILNRLGILDIFANSIKLLNYFKNVLPQNKNIFNKTFLQFVKH
jgi:hypothetical protein